MTRLVIHAGDCKAGSTAIQSVLRDGTYTCTGARPLYPEAGRRGGLNHHPLSNALFMPNAKRWQAKAWGALASEVTGTAPEVAIVSSERFEFAEPNALMTVLREHFGSDLPPVEIVIYVRPHIDRIASGYVQNVKQGLFDGPPGAFMEKMAEEGRFHFAPRLDRWASVFAGQRVTIRPMIRDRLAGGCVVHDLLNHCLGPDGGSAVVERIPQGNASLSAPALALVRRIWGEVRRDSVAAAALNAFAGEAEDSGAWPGDKVALPRALAEKARDLYAEDARACDTRHFGAPVLGPALNAAVEKAPEVADLPEPGEEAVIAARLWLQTIEKLQARKGRGGGSPTSAQWRGTGRRG